MVTTTNNGSRKKAATKGNGGTRGRVRVGSKGHEQEGTKSTMPRKAASTTEGKGNQEKGRLEALERAISQIDTAFGTGSIMRLAGDQIRAVEGVSTGTLSLDLALGGRGGERRVPWRR